MNYDKRLWVLIASVIFLSLSMVGCQWTEPAHQEEVEDRVAVVVGTVTRQTVTRGIHLSGQLEASAEVAVVAEVNGTVERVHVQVGDGVEEGDLLIELRSDYLETQRDATRAQLRVAQAGMEEARQALRIAQREHDRMEPLYREGVISQQQWDQVQDNLSRAQHAVHQQLPAQLQQAQTALSAIEKQMSELMVVAPIGGEVSLVNTSEGNMVGAGSPMMILVDRERMKVRGLLSERQVVQVQPGDTVRVQVPSLGTAEWEGVIDSIAPSPPQGMSGYPFSVSMDNPETRLRPGMSAEMMIPIEEAKDALVIPLEAVVEQDGQSRVFVVDDEGYAQLRLVELGISDGQYHVVERGLSAGEYVVIVGAEYLETGTRVDAEGMTPS